MPIQVKLIFTVFALLVLVFVLFFKKVDSGSKADWLWRGGKNDSIRKLIGSNSGNTSKATKAALCVAIAGWILFVWILM